jgi:hypothetical protein
MFESVGSPVISFAALGVSFQSLGDESLMMEESNLALLKVGDHVHAFGVTGL